jgi:uncharacterized protein
MALRRSRSWRRFARITLCVLTGAYLAMVVGCSVFQRALLYYPTHDSASLMERTARSAGFERWKNSSGENIGWHRASPLQPVNGEMLITHGNGGAAFHRVNFAGPLRDSMHLDVYILEYPGFGDRSGEPDQNSLFMAAEEAFQAMPKEAPVYLVAESLGTGVAAHLAGSHPANVAGVLLFAPYNNLVDVAQYHVRILPARWLMQDHFESEEFIQRYHGPVAIVVGGRDAVVPSKYGRRLFESYDGPKQLWEFPDASHNTFQPASAQFWKEVETFWNLENASK